jgi:hypothetical protein
MCTKVNYGSVGGCEGWTARRTPSRLQGEEPMGMRADEPHLHRLYSTNSPGDGWVGQKVVYEGDMPTRSG